MAGHKDKIHLAKEYGSLDIACNTPKTFSSKFVTNFYYKVTCFHCLRIVESMKRAGKLSLLEVVNYEVRNN
jgi:hypothetical protein